MVGSFSDFCMFSFDPVKTVTCIDGGALIVKSKEDLTRLREMRLVGMGQPSEVMYQNQRAWTYDVKHLGYRYHMANMHAAIGLAQLGRFDVISATRREACRYYNERLGGIAGVSVPQTDFSDVTPFLYYIRVPAEDREPLRAHLRERGIDSGIHWQPGHWFTLFNGCRRGDLSVTDRVGNEVLSLPLHSCMAADTLGRVADGVETYFSKRSGG
jgi:dTDP-4-amino-4,6-dideoxygalactose transaminase